MRKSAQNENFPRGYAPHPTFTSITLYHYSSRHRNLHSQIVTTPNAPSALKFTQIYTNLKRATKITNAANKQNTNKQNEKHLYRQPGAANLSTRETGATHFGGHKFDFWGDTFSSTGETRVHKNPKKSPINRQATAQPRPRTSK